MRNSSGWKKVGLEGSGTLTDGSGVHVSWLRLDFLVLLPRDGNVWKGCSGGDSKDPKNVPACIHCEPNRSLYTVPNAGDPARGIRVATGAREG